MGIQRKSPRRKHRGLQKGVLDRRSDEKRQPLTKMNMMQKVPSVKEISARARQEIRQWLLGEEPMRIAIPRPNFLVAINEGTIVYYKADKQRQVSVLSRDALVYDIIAASLDVAASYEMPEVEMTNGQALDCLKQTEAHFLQHGFDRLIKDEIPPISFVTDPGFCFHRMMIPRFEPAQEWIDTPRQWEGLGPFLNGIRMRMSDYNAETDDSTMFRRLLTALGALVWSSEPSREIIYWHGLGGDGKTTFCNFIASKLGCAAMPNLKPAQLEHEYYLAELEGKRFVVAEEAGAGQFLTEGLKAITGNRFITGRSPYKPIRTFRNHTMIWFTSNKMPIIDGEDSSTDRLRLISSTPPKKAEWRPESDIFDELESHWPHIVDMAVTELFGASKRVLPMTAEELEDPVDSYFMSADGWIEANLVYEPGAFLPNSSIKHLLRRDKISLRNIESRITSLQSTVYEAGQEVTKAKKRMAGRKSNPVWGYENVGLSYGHQDLSIVPWQPGPNRTPLKAIFEE